MKNLPHQGVLARIGPSKIHGVGVFAVADIPKGTWVFSHDDEPMVWVDQRSVQNLPAAIKKLYDDFCVIKEGQYGCPRSFDFLTTSWYLNHSSRPNMAADHNYRFYALRDIKAGEELTADYSTYSELPKSTLARQRSSAERGPMLKRKKKSIASG